MDQIKVKIESYDQSSHSLVVTFSGENETGQYTTQKMAFDIHNLGAGVLTSHEIIQSIAKLGLQYLENEVAKSVITNNPDVINSFNNMVSQEFNFNVDDIKSAPQIVHLSVNSPGDLLEIDL